MAQLWLSLATGALGGLIGGMTIMLRDWLQGRREDRREEVKRSSEDRREHSKLSYENSVRWAESRSQLYREANAAALGCLQAALRANFPELDDTTPVPDLDSYEREEWWRRWTSVQGDLAFYGSPEVVEAANDFTRLSVLAMTIAGARQVRGTSDNDDEWFTRLIQGNRSMLSAMKVDLGLQ